MPIYCLSEFARYEGCHKWLKDSEIPQHEENCKGGLYLCPICPNQQFDPKPALYLIDHIKKTHKKYISSNPLFQINTRLITRQYYFYVNPYLNQMLLFYLNISGYLLSMNASTLGPKPELISQRIKIFENYPDKHIFTSSWKACSAWNTQMEIFIVKLPNELRIFSVEFQFEQLKKAVNLNFALPLEMNSLRIRKKIGPGVRIIKSLPSSSYKNNLQYSLQVLRSRNKNWNLTDNFPKFYLQNLKDKRLKAQLSNPIFSTCGKYIVSEESEIIMDIRCSFCETYYPLIYDNCIRIIHKCSQGCTFSLCNGCLQPEIKCQYCRGEIKVCEDELCFALEYYCRFGCTRYFSGSKLYEHEESCKKSIFSLPDSVITENYFGPDFYPWSSLFRTNKFYLFSGYFENRGRAYVVDQRGFNYILDFDNSDDIVDFKIHHNYDPTKWTVVIKILKNYRYGQHTDTCSFSISYTDKTQFAIVLKNVNSVS